MGLSGIAYWGSDIGGFHAVVNPRTDDELNIRWLQFGAVSGVMRTQANGFSFRDNRADALAGVEPDGAARSGAATRSCARSCYPYIAAASETYQRTGMPLTRHLSLAFPRTPPRPGGASEFMFGPDLLVAPVIEPGARERKLYLPRPGAGSTSGAPLGFDAGRGALRLGAREAAHGRPRG